MLALVTQWLPVPTAGAGKETHSFGWFCLHRGHGQWSWSGSARMLDTFLPPSLPLYWIRAQGLLMLGKLPPTELQPRLELTFHLLG